MFDSVKIRVGLCEGKIREGNAVVKLLKDIYFFLPFVRIKLMLQLLAFLYSLLALLFGSLCLVCRYSILVILSVLRILALISLFYGFRM